MNPLSDRIRQTLNDLTAKENFVNVTQVKQIKDFSCQAKLWKPEKILIGYF